MRGEVHILVNCPIDTFLKEKQHSGIASFDHIYDNTNQEEG